MDGAFADAFYDRGYSYYEVGRFEEALADLDRAIELDPEEARYYAHRSLVYLFTDRLDLAEADQDKSDELRSRGF
jgi:tetratricopeptide (TPR) repeat protein